MPSLDHPGSSPHTRGALRMGEERGGSDRIIPAYAGSTPNSPPKPASGPDHPRIRGEHQLSLPGSSWTAGSSPHTRGAHDARRDHGRHLRIIPAYAGSTCPFPDALLPWTDHPRIRGEHAPSAPPRPGRCGSSPHTRGARQDCELHVEHERIIPAYAGSTRGLASVPLVRSDHPRIRGEHPPRRSAGPRRRGSSPHTRGARFR